MNLQVIFLYLANLLYLCGQLGMTQKTMDILEEATGEKVSLDVPTSPQRHVNMAAIHGKDTKPEMVVRRYLWSHGFRYRLNHRGLPGKPDIVLRKYRTCIFVNGCFWHGHEGCRFYTVPKSNTEFWTNKVKRNKERDLKVQRELSAMGWHSITVWECELKPAKRESTLESLAYTLNKIFLRDRTIHRYEMPEEAPMLAAEDFSDNYGNE